MSACTSISSLTSTAIPGVLSSANAVPPQTRGVPDVEEPALDDLSSSLRSLGAFPKQTRDAIDLEEEAFELAQLSRR